MLLTYQYKLNPTSQQVVTLETWGELLRRHWNYALGERLDGLWRTRSQIDRCSLVCEPIGEIPDKPDYYTQASDLKRTKELFPDYKNIYADCQQQNLMRLDKAWKRWLIPDKKGKRGGKPRFKKRGDISSFTFPRVNSPKAGAHLVSNTLKLSKIGEVKIILHRPIPDGFEIKQATILSKADGWYVSFSLEDKTVPNALSRDKITTVTGIDVGLEKFLTTADGQSVEVPQYYRKAQSALARQQRQLARKIIGSKNHKKQANTLARLHLHVARQRKEFHYHVAHWLVNSYDLIVFENLNIRGLARTRLALSILDVAWGAFLQIMQAVAVKRGKLTLGVDARNTSINCSSCGERVEKTLAVRIHSCSCGLVIDRDWNSALNLLKRGLALSEVVRASVSEGEGSVGLPIPGCGGLGDTQPVKQQVSFVNLRCSRYTACG
ncbi:transposase [Desmonostoc muscorum LEGE 12446]|uniref:Transposase n=1 Tax=Desmonostoc muscorum LEGE 12446 TaxID=1828758 RepID=A0A8J6ZY10_DESMC|nr:RNA-guided endonuclease TnpB family protein [Desmonostoc muscorum]MCF2145713.1 transposase [Desmonostoc muscorum LEGE 12446]